VRRDVVTELKIITGNIEATYVVGYGITIFLRTLHMGYSSIKVVEYSRDKNIGVVNWII